MSNFRLGSLSDVGKFIRGITFKPTDTVEFGNRDSVVCMRTKNVQRDLDESDLMCVPSRFIKRREQILQHGDLLVSSANSWNLVGKCCWVPELNYSATAGGFISIFRADSAIIDKRYLYHWFSSAPTQSRLRQCSRQTTNISNLSIPQAEELEIPLPPLPEQKRIAAILDKADAIRRKREQAIELTDSFLRSVFLEMFGDPVKNHKGWKITTVEEITDCIRDGPHVSPKYAETGIPILSTRNIRPRQLILKDMKYVSPETYAELTRRFKPQKGDVLLTKGGTTGYAKVVDFDWDFAVWVHLAVLRPNSRILPAFLEHVLNTSYCYQQSQRFTRGIANRDLGLTRIAKIQFPLPPLTEQQKFLEYVAKADELRLRQQMALHYAQALVSSASRSLLYAESKTSILKPVLIGQEAAHAV